MNMALKIRYLALAVMGIAAALSFVNVTLFLLSNPSTATLWDRAIVDGAVFGTAFFAIVAWVCVNAIIEGRRM